MQQRRLLTPIRTDGNPLAAAISRSGNVIYVASKDASALDVIDLDSQSVVNRVTLPAQPEGVAVGVDERVLISTIGSGAGNQSNVLLIYDPATQGPTALAPVPVTPLPPQNPKLVDHARSASAEKRGGGLAKISLDQTADSRPDRTLDFLALNEALDALAQMSPRKAQVIELRYFSGLKV